MSTVTIRLGLFFVLLVASCRAETAELPRLGVGCANFNAPSGTAGTLFSRDCQTAYVLPPTVGKFEITSVALGGNLGLCPTFNATKSGLERRVEAIVTGQAAKAAGMDDAKTKQCLMYYQAKRFQENASTILQSSIEVLQKRLEQIGKQESECRTTQKPNCDVVGITKTGLVLEVSTAQAKMQSAKNKIAGLEAALITCGKLEELLTSAKIEPSKDDAGSTKVNQLNDDILALYNKYRNTEGATIAALFTADHSALIEQARQANSGFKVQGVASEMALAMTLQNPSSTISFPAALKVAVPGVAAPAAVFSKDEQNAKVDIFGPSSSGNITLSLGATCAASIDKSHVTSDVRPYFEVNAIYRYPVEVGTKITVTANFDEIYKRIVKNSTSNGLFHTSSSTEITDFTKTDEVIDVTFESTEGISLADRERIIAAVKSRVIERALSLVAREYIPGVGPVTPGAPPQLGATVAAKALRENCASKWCQVGAIVLDVAAAIFGGSDATASFVKEKHIAETETYDLSSVIYQYKTMGFQ